MNKENDKLFKKVQKLFINSFNALDSIDQTILNLYIERFKYLETELTELEFNEPNKIFKRKHKDWQNRKNELQLEKKLILEKIYLELNDL